MKTHPFRKKTGLLLILSLLIGFVQAQQAIRHYPFPTAKDKVLIGLEEGYGLESLEFILAGEQCFFQVDASAHFKQENFLIAFIDPNSPDRPADESSPQSTLDRLEASPAIRFAHPFMLSPNEAEFGVTDQVFAKLKDQSDLEQLRTICEPFGVRILKENEYIDRLYILQVDKHSNVDPVDFTIWLRDQDFLEYADMNYLFNPIVATNDPYYSHQWAHENNGTAIQGSGTIGADMSIPEAWTVTTGDSSIIVAILDSGTDTLHEDLVDNLITPGYDATGGGSKGWPNTVLENDAHGTNCAGIVAAKADNNMGVAGVCPDCKVIPVRVFYYITIPLSDPLPYSTGNYMADGISWAWQNAGAQILSNSWGMPDNLLPVLPDGTQPAEDAIDQALTNGRNGLGSLLFFSSGNDGGSPIWPSRLGGVFAVNATSMCDERKHPTSCDGQGWEGNYGDSLDIGAPGVRIATTDMSGSLGYDPSNYNLSFGGTSAACPNAAGVMALVLSVSPNIDVARAHELLETTADKVGGYAYAQSMPNGTWGPELGYGRINAFAAVQAAVATHTEAPGNEALNEIRVFPNPATESISLAVSRKQAGEMKISILDVAGRRIHEEKTNFKAPGEYRKSWKTGELFSGPGIYFLRLETKTESISKKVVILR